MTGRLGLLLAVALIPFVGMSQAASAAALPAPACDDTVLSVQERADLKAEILHALKESDAGFFERTQVYVGVGKLRATRKDVVAYVSSNDYCGSSGCTGLVLAQEPEKASGRMSYVSIGKVLPMRAPVAVLPSKHKGWNDLSVFVVGGGIREGRTAKLVFNGHRYPLNPAVQPRLASQPQGAQVLIGAPGSSGPQCRLQ